MFTLAQCMGSGPRSSQLSAMTILEDLMPSSGLHRHCTGRVHKHTQGKTHFKKSVLYLFGFNVSKNQYNVYLWFKEQERSANEVL